MSTIYRIHCDGGRRSRWLPPCYPVPILRAGSCVVLAAAHVQVGDLAELPEDKEPEGEPVTMTLVPVVRIETKSWEFGTIRQADAKAAAEFRRRHHTRKEG